VELTSVNSITDPAICVASRERVTGSLVPPQPLVLSKNGETIVSANMKSFLPNSLDSRPSDASAMGSPHPPCKETMTPPFSYVGRRIVAPVSMGGVGLIPRPYRPHSEGMNGGQRKPHSHRWAYTCHRGNSRCSRWAKRRQFCFLSSRLAAKEPCKSHGSRSLPGMARGGRDIWDKKGTASLW